MDNSKYTFHLIHHSINPSLNINSTNTNNEEAQISGASSSSSSTAAAASTTAATNSQNQSNDNELYEQKFSEISEQITSSGHFQPSALSNLVIESVVVSSQHIAFLLDNGRVCRVNYHHNNSSLNQSNSTNESTNNNNIPSNSNSLSSSRTAKHSKPSSNLSSTIVNTINNSSINNNGSFRQSSSSSSSSSRTLSSSSFVAAAAAAAAVAAATNTNSSGSTSSVNNTTSQNLTSNISNSSNAILRANEAFIIPSPHDILSSSSLSHTFGRGRRNQLLRGRVSNLIVGSSRIPPFVPASAVPESLIESVQTVLQSKSRSVIVRELQRTNLDVNLAVNNLLQRDDEGDDPTDDEDPYMHGDDLISLLDINSHHGESVLLEADGALFDEDSFRLSRRLGNSRGHSSNTNNTGGSTSGVVNNNNNNSNSSESIDRDSRKSSYRIRDQRWYDSYRDELFSHTHHRSNSSSSNSTNNNNNNNNNNSNNTTTDQSNALNEQKTDDFKKSVSSTTPATFSNKPSFNFGENLQYWLDKNNEPIKFMKIAGMHSELVGISIDGRLHQWKWSSDTPFSLLFNLNANSFSEAQQQATTTPLPNNNSQVLINHPKSIFLQLINEKICGISTSTMRASCWTESGKIAAWLDESVDIPSTIKYQTPAQNFYQSTDNNLNIINNERILDMSTSNLFTVIRTNSGSIYWWGIMPFEQRAKLIDKYHSKSQKSKSNNILNEITVGSFVSLKSLPLYNIGTVALTVKDGQPRIGQLNEHVFALRDSKSYKFKIKNTDYFKDAYFNNNINNNSNNADMPPPPSPTVDISAQIVTPQPLTGSLKRKKQYLTNEISEDKKPKVVELYDEESWFLNEVVLVEDSKSTILGKAVKVDNDYVLVKMQAKLSDNLISSNDTDVLENSRIFPKNQLQLIKQSSSSKLPDFMQKTPKKVSDFGAVLAVSAQQNGFHAIVSKENALFYILFDLMSNKIVKEKRFTTSLNSFLGKNPNNIQFYTQDDPNFNTMTLIDGNSNFYPLIEISGSNVLKDPQWKNLFQVKCFSQCILTNLDNDSVSPKKPLNNKKMQFVSFFAMKMEQLMTSIFRYDLNRVTRILRQLEFELNQNGGNSKRLKRILNERCDGNRNILHAAVFICAPTSNNESNNTTSAATTSRSNKFSDSSSYNDIYATYGTTPSSNFLSKTSSSSSSIERPWSTSTSSNNNKHSNDLSMRKINISIDSIQSQSSTLNEQQQQQQTTTKLTPENTDSSSIPTSFWPPLPPTDPLACSIKPAYIQTWSSVKLTDKEKKQNANKILEELLTTPILQIKPVNVVSSSLQTEYNYLCDLLSHKSADGLTPFMYAVSLRAYDAGLMILETALKMRMNLTQTLLKLGNLNNLNYKRDLLFTNMIFPLGSRTDQSPLFVLCSNDTCSFTWTGDNHITQDIFECRTCTLVGNLCCCTECARTCHKGHDCKIKTSSPTAYCDCWEKCKCKSLIAGDQEKRFKLLDKLLAETTLLNASNSRGESILTYLVQTVGRQIQEQRNYKRHCGNSNLSASSRRTIASSGYAANTSSDNNANSSGGITGNIGDMPQHDLEPPKFCKRALERIFNDWYSIKQIFLFNNSRYQSDSDAESTSSDDDDDDDDKEDLYNSRLNKKKKSNKLREQMGLSSFAKNSLLFDESAYMDAQSGCVDLDKFVYLLIMKCPSDILTILVDTIQSNLNDTQNKENEDKNESIMVVKRLVRSVTRLFVILCIETSPSNLQINLNLNSNQSSSKISTNQSNRTDSSNLTSKMSINSRLARFKSLNTTNNPTPSTPPPPHPPSTTTTTTIASLVTVSPIAKCEYILKQFSKYSIEELANAAHSLIAPVVLGITKPSTYKLSILSSNLTGSNNTVSFNSNNNNSGEFSSSGVNGNNANSLADELFNLEPPIQRLFTTAISTNLILPTPESVKSMLSTNPQQQQLSTVKTETPQFINTFESVHFSNNNNNQANDSLIQNDETLSENSNAAKNDLIQEKDDTQNSSSMPPPLMSNQDSSSSQQLNIESDNNSNSSTASNKSNRSVNRARSVASSSKCSSSTAKQRHGALSHFSNRDSSNSSKSSGSSTSSASSSNNSNDSNHSNSNSSSSSSSSSASNSSSNSSDSSSDTNSNDTAITESSASTSNTKRSTMALKNGRSGESGSTNIPNLVNRRVTSVNFVDPFSLILLNSRNSNSSIDANIGDDTTSLTTQSTLSRHRSRHSQHKNNRSSNQEDFNNNNNNNNSKLETSSVVSSSSLATTGNDFSQTGNRSIASYFTDEDDDDDDEEDEDNDEIDNDDNNSNDLSTNDDDDDDNNNKNNNDDEFDDNNEEQSSEIMDENSSDRKNKRKRKRILLNKNVASTDKNAKKSEISSQVSGKKSLETSLNQTNREDEEEIENEQDDDIDDDVDDDENEDVDDEEDEDLDDFDIEQYNDDENMDTSQDNNDLNGITNNIQLNSENSKKKNNKQVSNKTSYNIIPITIKSNLRSSYETPPPPPPLPIATTTTKSTDEKSKSLPTNSTLLNPIDSSKRPVNTQLKSSSSTVSLNTTNSTSNSNINTQTAPNPTTLYSPSSSNFQRTTTQTNNLPITRSILPTNSSVSAETASSNSQQRRSNSSASITGSSTINTIIQQYNNNNNNSNNSIISQGYDQQRINIINSINQSSSSSLGSSATPIQSSSTTSSTGSSIPLTAQPPTYHHTQSGANNNHHMTLGDYYYAAHNLANTTNSISNSGSNSFSNILNNSNIILDSHRNHGHHSHQHHTTANLTANTIPTSNSAISGSVPQTELISSFNTPSSASLTNNTLARVFSILVKLIRDLLNNVYLERIEHQKFLNNKKESKNHKKAVSKYLQKITKKINKKLESPWQWLVSLMDSTESQLRFGASLSASQMSELSTNATQYLRHLEEKALLTNYFNNHGNSSQNNYGYYSSNNLVGGGPFISSRFGSGIDARRKLNIMQHQHQQFANMHLNQSYQHYNPNSIQIASNNYYQPQNLQASSSGSSQGSTNQVGTSFGISSISRSSNASGNILNSNADQIIQANTTNTSSNSNNNNSQSISTLASQFAASQIISSRRDFMSYALSLMRAQTNEHRDSLPSIDISLLKHVAYIFDGILFYLQSNLSNSMASIKIETEESSDDEEESLDENTTNDTEGIEEDDSDDSESENKKFKKKINIKDYYYFEKDDESEEEEEEENLKQFDDKILGSYYYDDDDGGDDDDDDDDDEDDDDNKSIESNDKDKESKSDEKSKNKSDEESIEFSHDKSKKRKFNFINNSDEKKKTENKPFLIKNPCSRTSSFFKRSNSTLCLGAESPDPFAYSLEESLPLASKPHLLQPHSRIQDMFKIKSNNVAQFISLKNIGLMSYNLRSNAPELKDPFLYKKSHKRNHSIIKKNQDSKHSGKQAAAAESKKVKKQSSKYLDKFEKKLFKLASINDQYIKDPSISQISKPNNLIDRWRLTVDLFGRVFCDDVGLEPASIIRQFGGFQLKEAKFRREMERLRNIATRELLMEVERERDLLLLTTFKSLNNMYNLQYSRRAAAAANMSGNSGSSSSTSSTLLPPPLCLNRIKVTFKDEQGEGSGVARSFYTAFSEAILADLKLPSLESCSYTSSTSSSSLSSNQSNSSVSYVPFSMLQRYRNSRSSNQVDLMVNTHRRPNSSATYSSIPIPTNSVLTRSSIRARDQLLLINSAVSYATSSSLVANSTSESADESIHQNTASNSVYSNTTPSSNNNGQQLSVNAPPFFSPLIAITSSALNDLPSFDLSFYNSLDVQHREYGQQLFTKISSLLSQNQQTPNVNTFKAAKITGMLLELRSNQIQQLLSSDSLLKSRFDESCNLLASTTDSTTSSSSSSSGSSIFSNLQNSFNKSEQTLIRDDSPLFWQPDKSMACAGFYAPRAGLNTTARLNAFRNVGRIMAICLLQNELCPITLSRHAIKYILNKPIKWHDLAFFDSQMYESFRKMINDAEKVLVSACVDAKESCKIKSKSKIRVALIRAIADVNEQLFKPLDLTFNIDLPREEDGTNNDLIENGSKIEVNVFNMYEYVKRYAEFRMVSHVELCLQELKSGVFDVLPANALDGLTAEDFRLLLNGVADINIHTLASYTTISDESKESSRRPHFEKWFWATLEKMNQQEKQELLFFWTGSPYLPASEEGFQPLPTITLRPPSDQHLPTANTCINRLYLPMYSSKSILKSKILQAIKTKTFGFV